MSLAFELLHVIEAFKSRAQEMRDQKMLRRTGKEVEFILKHRGWQRIKGDEAGKMKHESYPGHTMSQNGYGQFFHTDNKGKTHSIHIMDAKKYIDDFRGDK